ncbi:phosphotransferase [Thioclava sp. GXIMD4215]|uniref:phosphotransferase n=1 Tax=Thioclava sp. GXIMD4215 TaxID=3131928 RepID=UPI003249ECEA
MPNPDPCLPPVSGPLPALPATGAPERIDLGSLSTRCQTVGPEHAARLAQELWGLSGDITRLDTEKDDTFALRQQDRKLIFKIANPAEPPAELDLQIQTLAHLNRHAPDLPVPRIVPALNGAALVALPLADGIRHARMMTYLEGDLLDTLPPLGPEQYRIGEMNAKLRLAMTDFRHPFAARQLAWDIRHLPRLAELLDHVPDQSQRSALTRAFRQILSLRDDIEALPRQILHNDFSRSNLLVDRRKAQPITGIIDFGDVVETAVAIDLSTAMLNQLPRDAAEQGQDGMFAGPTRLFEGHIAHAPLSKAERRLLPHLVFARVVTRALLTLWRAGQFPENRAYILRNTAQGWAQLDWYLSQNPAALSARLL